MALVSGGGGGAPTGAAGGDLGGTYPNPTVDLNTSGGTINGAVEIHGTFDQFEGPGATGSELLIQPGNTETSGAHALSLFDHSGNRIIDYQAVTGGFVLRNSSNVRTMQAQPDGYTYLGLNLTAHVLPAGAWVTRQHAAPADADLAAGDMAVWFDQTNGAGKLMVKAKTADGTVVTGSLALA